MRSVLLVRIAALVGGLLLAATLIVVASGAWLRSRVVAFAAGRGLTVDIDRARMGWFAAHFRGLHVALEGVPEVAIELADVDVEVDARGRPTRVVVEGGTVRGSGDPERLAEDVRGWRARHAGSPATAEKGGAEHAGPSIVARGLALDAPLPGGGTLTAKDLGLERDGADVRASAADVRADRDDARALAQSLKVHVVGKKLRSATLESLAVEVGPREAAAPAKGAPAASAASASASSEPPPPLLPAVVEHVDRREANGAKKKKPLKPVEPAAPSEPLRVDLPDVAPLRARALVLAQSIVQALDDGAEVQIAALSMRVQSGGEKLTLGPGRAGLVRSPEHVDLQFASNPKGGGTPLSASVELPLGASPLRATLSGGPLTFAALGVQEGAFGLIDVQRAQLSGKANVAIDGQGSMTFDADLTGRGVGLQRAWLADAPVHGLDVGLRLAGAFDSKKRLRVDDAEAALGAMRVRFRGTLEAEPDRARMSGFVEVPASACQSLLDSVPEGLMPTVRAAHLSGTFGAMGRFSLDTTALDDMDLVYRIDDRCKFVDVPSALDRERFRHPFMHRIVKPDGDEADMETGPDSENWTPLEAISPYMQSAVLTTEDGAFFRHHGFNHGAIKGAIVANLKAKRFVRGASTISMQLAKNLFLSRHKTLSRKLEEVVLTDYLEQTFSKEEIIELYLNVIEFGPMIYGITAGSEHYFGRKPEELNLAECMFLATLLPRPIDSHKMWERGAISEGWAKNVRSLIEIAFRTGKVSEAERNEGLSESIVFYKEGQPRPTPRAPVTGGRGGNLEDEWKAVE